MPCDVEPSAPLLCWMVPPVPLALLDPSPTTVSPPDVPVVSRMIPSPVVPEPVPALIDLNVRPLAPIVVPVTLSAVLVVVARVLELPVTVTVPPLVAVKAAFEPVERLTPPENVTPPPEPPWSLLSSRTPVPPSGVPTEPSAPLNVTTASADLFWTVTARPELMFEMAPASLKFPEPPSMNTAPVVVFWIVPAEMLVGAFTAVRLMPVPAPSFETSVKSSVPSTLLSSSAVPVVLVTDVCDTLTPVTGAAFVRP